MTELHSRAITLITTCPDRNKIIRWLKSKDGLEFLHKLRTRPKGRTVPIVVLIAKDLSKQEYAELSGNVTEIFTRDETNIEEWVL